MNLCVCVHIYDVCMYMFVYNFFSLVPNLISSRLMKHLSGPRPLKSLDYQSYDFLACMGKTAEEHAGRGHASSMARTFPCSYS